MSQRSGTSKRVLARIQRLCCLGIGSEMLMPDLVREVVRLLPARHGMFRWAGPNLEITNSYNTVSPRFAELHLKELYLKPPETDLCRPFRQLMTLPEPNPVLQFWKHTLIVDRSTFMRSYFYDVLWRPCEGGECLMLRVREARRHHGALYAWRAPGEAPFEPRDLRLLESIVGFVAHGMSRSRLGSDAFEDSDDRALLIADLGGTVRHLGRQAQSLLMMALVPRWSPTANWRRLHEPVPEIAWLCGVLAATASGRIGQPPPVLRLRNPWGEFVLRAYWLGPTDGAEQTREIGVTVERRVPRALALRRRVEDLPLTSREKQLCLLLARDLSGQDLTSMMGLASSTVITHQRSAYSKLGVHSRTELLAALHQRECDEHFSAGHAKRPGC
ncbi:MAG: helix-turn-helix transcriptional regulator [Acetobacteraceae bacterium]|nr:helix-turn-helix transcriptional regulator [Acetobacteraceae bacterium]